MSLTLSPLAAPPACTEHKLVAATRAGDDRAFEQLYARYRERIFSFILSKVHDHGRAEDIAQDVFLSALRRLRSSDQAIAFKPWIYEIAKNACIDEHRRGSRAREVPLESDGECVVDRQESAVSAVPTPVAAVESRQRLDDLRGAFGGLSATHRQLLVMREFEGLSYDEIGDRLDMTRQMVESSLFRARRKLGEEYRELASGRRCEQIQSAIEAGRLRAVSSLGLRDRRRFARHLAHCQPCRHVAFMAGVDEALIKPRSIAAKIAALLPFPAWRLPWRSRDAKTGSAAGSHHLAGGGAAGVVPSAGSAITLGQAAATVAVLIAGAGGGLAIRGLAMGSHPAPAKAAGGVAPHGASSSGSAAASAAAAKAAYGAASLRTATSAISLPPRQPTPAKRTHGRRQRRGSAPGAPGTGAGASSSTPKQATAATGGVTKAVNGVSKTATDVTNGVSQTVNGVTHGVSTTVSGVTNGVSTTVNGVANGVSTTVNGVTSGSASGVTSGVSQTVDGVTSGATQAASGTTSGVSQTVTGVASGASSVTSGVAGALGGSASGSSGTATSPSSSLLP